MAISLQYRLTPQLISVLSALVVVYILICAMVSSGQQSTFQLPIMAYDCTAAATVNLLLSYGRLYNLAVAGIERKYFVKSGSSNIYVGTLYYNNVDDLLGDQVAKTGIVDNKLSVIFKKGATDVALFKTTANFSDGITEVDNPGSWEKWSPIRHTLSPENDWKLKQEEVRTRIPPDVPTSLTDTKERWLQGIVRNGTDFQIYYIKSYLDSGRYDKAPGPLLDPFDLDTFTGCERDGSQFTGVSGGITYRIDIDEKHSYYFSIGFTHPYIGAYKASVVASDNPVDAYNAASPEGGSIESSYYAATDTDKKTFKFCIRISATAGQRPNYFIYEVRYYD